MPRSSWQSAGRSNDSSGGGCVQQSVPCPCLALRPPAPDDLTLRPGQRVLPHPEKQGNGQLIGCPYPLLIYGIFSQYLATQTCCSSFCARNCVEFRTFQIGRAHV